MDTTFRSQGYFEVAKAVRAEDLAMLRQVCDVLLAEPIDDGGRGRHRIGLGAARRFLAHRHVDFPALESFLLGPTMAAITRRGLGAEGYLFNEQFVVKGAGIGAAFDWHQDSAYVGFDHPPYLTVWIALDDTDEDNGCVYLLPRDLATEPGIDPHTWDADGRALTGYTGDAPGLAMRCRAGAIVAFSSVTMHRSGANRTDRPRRAYIAQYTRRPLRDPQTGLLKRFAKPVAAGAA